MKDRQHAQVVQDNLALISRNRELELQLYMCKKALGECERLADEMREASSNCNDYGKSSVAGKLRGYAYEIKAVCSGTYD